MLWVVICSCGLVAQSDEVHWSLRPVHSSPVPEVSRATWSHRPLDRFVLAALESRGLAPSEDASRDVVLRRLYFDLTGLLPSLEAQRRFRIAWEQDPQRALEQIVDHLLASPEFGRKWASDWLDAVRFAESNGGDRNVLWPHAWRYRDYVIESLNGDQPFDEFVREQIAGDLIAASRPDDPARIQDRRQIATGFLTLGPKLFMETNSEQFRMDRVDEQIDVVSRSLMGFTISCARCHDHKFDPVSARDYYALAGIFRNTYLLSGTAAPAGNQYGHDRPLKPIGQDAQKLHGPALQWKEEVAAKTAERNKARSDRYRIVRQKAARENDLSVQMAAEGTLQDQDQDQDQEKLEQLRAEISELEDEIKSWDKTIAKLDAELEELEQNPPPLPDYCMAVTTPEAIEDSPLYEAGRLDEASGAVPRGSLSLPGMPAWPTIESTDSGRMQLARWLTSPSHPLTARVAVNRIWAQLFGQGIVSSVDNFGLTGDRPTHPALLDHLAHRFVHRHQWSRKRLIKEIVLSRTYRLASRTPATEPAGDEAGSLSHAEQVDPDNRLLHRATLRPLSAEALRDALLLVSGDLRNDRPPQGTLLLLDGPELNATVRIPSETWQQTFRSVYLPIARHEIPDFLAVFGFPDRTLPGGSRAKETTAAQQLFMMNSPLVADCARGCATRIVERATSDRERISLLYQMTLARLPEPQEQNAVLDYLAACRSGTPVDKEQPSADTDLAVWENVVQAILLSAEFRYLP